MIKGDDSVGHCSHELDDEVSLSKQSEKPAYNGSYQLLQAHKPLILYGLPLVY